MLQCQECRKTIHGFELGWSAFFVEDPDESGAPPELVTYCPDCLTREFGGLLYWLAGAPRQRS